MRSVQCEGLEEHSRQCKGLGVECVQGCLQSGKAAPDAGS